MAGVTASRWPSPCSYPGQRLWVWLPWVPRMCCPGWRTRVIQLCIWACSASCWCGATITRTAERTSIRHGIRRRAPRVISTCGPCCLPSATSRPSCSFRSRSEWSMWATSSPPCKSRDRRPVSRLLFRRCPCRIQVRKSLSCFPAPTAPRSPTRCQTSRFWHAQARSMSTPWPLNARSCPS